MARLKKIHKEILKKKNVSDFLDAVGELKEKFGLEDFHVKLAFEAREPHVETCTLPNRWKLCDIGDGRSREFCLAPGEGCPPC
jgi:hypothetical protein